MQEIDLDKLVSVLYSRGTMHALKGLLPDDDRDQLRTKMTSRKLDWQNPCGMQLLPSLRKSLKWRKTSWNLATVLIYPESHLELNPKVRECTIQSDLRLIPLMMNMQHIHLALIIKRYGQALLLTSHAPWTPYA